MPRGPDEQRRAELLDAVIAAFASGGIGDRSLRELAAAVGTSHRMLLHHFGSRDELLLAVVQEVERRQAAKVPDLPRDAPAAFRATWDDLRRPEQWAFERLFFECYARGAHGEHPFDQLLPSAVRDWIGTMVDAGADEAGSRLALAVVRGLLLDLVATGDEQGVDAAAERFAALLGRSRRAPASAARQR